MTHYPRRILPVASADTLASRIRTEFLRSAPIHSVPQQAFETLAGTRGSSLRLPYQWGSASGCALLRIVLIGDIQAFGETHCSVDSACSFLDVTYRPP